MGTSIDNRIVSMKFDNAQFESGVKTSLTTLDRLKSGLNFDGASKSLSSLSKGVKGFSVASISNGVGELELKFSAFGIAAATVISNITTALTNKLAGGIKSVVGLISGGGMKRAQNLEQARFSMQGLLESTNDAGEAVLNYGFTVDDVMKEGGPVQNAVKGTAYGLDEAAKAASNFIASGITDMDELEYALKSISGSAAQTGDSYENMARIYGKVAGQGRVMGDDLNSMASRGVNAAATIAKYLNAEKARLGSYSEISPAMADQIAKLKDYDESLGLTEGNVRDLVSASVINFDIFSHAMYESFGENAFRANETFSGSLSNMKAALSRFGAKFATPYLNNMRDIFNALRPMIDAISKALDPIVNKINELFSSLTQFGIGKINAINDFFAKFNKAVKPDTAMSIKKGADAAAALQTEMDKLSQKKAPNAPIEKIAVSIGNFAKAASNIGGAIKNIFSSIAELFKSLNIGKPILDIVLDFSVKLVKFTSRIKDFTNISDKVKKAISYFSSFGILTNILGSARNIISGVVNIFRTFIKTISSGFGSGKLTESIDKLLTIFSSLSKSLYKATDRFKKFTETANGKAIVSKPLQVLAKVFGTLTEKIKGAVSAVSSFVKDGSKLKKVGSTISSIFSKIGKVLEKFGEAIKNTFSDFDLSKGAGILVLFGSGGIIYKIIQAFSSLKNSVSGIGGIITAIETAIGKLSDMFSVNDASMIENIRSFSISMALLAASLAIVSMIDSTKLLQSVTALETLFVTLIAALAVMNQITVNKKGMLKTASSLTALATAVMLLSVSMKILSGIDTNAMIMGTMSISVLIGVMAMFSNSVGKIKSRQIQKTTKSLISLAIAIDLLVIAVKQLGQMDTDELIQGLLAVGGVLLGLSLFSRFNKADGTSLSSGAGIILLATGLLIISKAVSSFGSMDYDTLYNGLMGVALSLSAIAIYAKAVQKSGIMSASAALLISAAALALLVVPMKQLGAMDGVALSNGLVAMALAMSIVVAAFNLMPKNSIISAGALIVAAAGITVLAGALAVLAAVPLAGMLVGLGGLAAALLLLGIAGLALKPIIVPILGLSAAMALFGAGVLALATGLAVLTPVMTAFAVAFAGSIAILLTAIINSSDQILQTLVVLFKTIITALGEVTADIVKVILETIDSILAALAEHLPSIWESIKTILKSWLDMMVELTPMLAEAGLQMVISLLTTIRDNIKEVTALGIEIVAEFINGIAEGLPALIDSAFNLVISLILGIAEAIDNRGQELAEAAKKLGASLIGGLVRFVVDNVPKAVQAVKNLAVKIKKKLEENLTLKKFKEIGSKIINGIILGISSLISKITSKIQEVAKKLIDKFKSFLGINSPSTKFQSFGKDIINGLINGIGEKISSVVGKIKDVAGKIIGKAQELLKPDTLTSAGKNVVNGIRAGIAEKFDSLKTKVAAVGGWIKEKFSKDLDSEKYTKTGASAIAGIRKGMNDKLPDLTSKVSSIGNDVKNKFTEKLGSDKTKSIGTNAVAGVRRGMGEKDAELNAKASEIGKKAKDKLAESNKDYETVGENAILGFIKGMKNKQSTAISTVGGIGTSTANKLKNTLQEKSPSKLFFKIGAFAIEGFENAFKDTRSLNKTVETVGKTVSNLLQSNLDDIEASDPVITPVLDLSGIQNGNSIISSMLGSSNPLISNIAGNFKGQANTSVLDAIQSLTDMLNNKMDSSLTPEDIYEAIKTGAENAVFNVALDGRKITSVVNENNNDALAMSIGFLGG